MHVDKLLHNQDKMADIQLLLKAADFAAKKHRDQRRSDKETTPYINHPIGVANSIANEGGVTDIVVLQVSVYVSTGSLYSSPLG